MKRDISLYLKDIVDAMGKAEDFVGAMTYEEFSADSKTAYAVVRCIEIMGEAVKNIPQSIRDRYKEIPWRDMAGMRDKVSHFYFGVNLKTVWLVIKEDIPRLEPVIRKVLNDVFQEVSEEKT